MQIYLPFLLFIIDYTCFVLLDAPLMLCLIGDSFLHLAMHRAQPLAFAFALFLVSLQSFMFYGAWYFSYLSLIPLTALGIYLNRLFIKTSLLNGCLLAAYIVCNNLLLALLFGRIADLKNYTVWQFCATMVLIMSMSLIIRVAGTTDNRL